MTGQYGLQGMYCGVPVILGREGIERILEVPLTTDEKAALAKSAADVKANLEKLATL
jgi:malate dehydrogenase